jgi:hypothetical protein
MKKLILLLMLFSTPVMAVEPITGAFGVKLGDVWDGEATRTDEEDGYVVHHFIPDLPHDLFDTYVVHVTPVKKLIYLIWGGKVETGECEQYQDLKKALIKKYGAGIEFDEFTHFWGQGNNKLENPDIPHARTILVRCNVDEETYGFHISYLDRDIYDSIADDLPDTSNL